MADVMREEELAAKRSQYARASDFGFVPPVENYAQEQLGNGSDQGADSLKEKASRGGALTPAPGSDHTLNGSAGYATR